MTLFHLIIALTCLTTTQAQKQSVKVESQALLQSAFNRRKTDVGDEVHEDGSEQESFCQRLSDGSESDASDECIDGSLAPVELSSELPLKVDDLKQMHHDDDTMYQADSFAADRCRIALVVFTLLLCMSGLWRLFARAFAGSHEIKRNASTTGALCPSASIDPQHNVHDWGLTSLHKAANVGSATEVEMLLNDGFEIDAVDVCGATPLHLAARGGHSDICDILCKHGASVNAKNVDQLTPLLMAGRGGHEDTCKVLFGHGGDTDNLAISSLPIVLQDLMLPSSQIDSN